VSHSSLSFLRRTRAASLATALIVSASLAGAAQSGQQGGPPQKQHSVSEKTQEAFGKLKPLQDTQNYAGMLALLEGVQVVPNSYDEALILDMKAKIYGMTNQLAKALPPWERVVQLADQYGYFDKKTILDIVFYLAQIYAQEGSTSKDPAVQQEAFTKSLMYFKRYLDNTPKPTPEAMMAYASVLYYRASASATPDPALLQQARDVVEKGLQSAIKPKEGFYQLLLTLQQQQNDLVGSADILELLLKKSPNKKDYWQLLMATYLQLSEKAKDPTLSREYLTRAIVTCERAQALGHLNTPKDNMNLVSLYLMANQFTKGTELLYNGMKSNKIESEPNNWRVLGRYYLEANLNVQAIAVLQEAAKLFPKNSEIEVQLAQIYLQMEKTKEAMQHAKNAIEKNNFETTKPYSVHYLVAYTAYELGNLDEALAAISRAEKFPEAADDAQLPKLKNVVTEAINEREAAKESKDSKGKKGGPAGKTANTK
jgi:tetratricopeptide (TPR) repeat protein